MSILLARRSLTGTLALLLIATGGCESPSAPEQQNEIIAIKFRTFLSFSGEHRDAAMFWLTQGNSWQNHAITSYGDTISITCQDCPPPTVYDTLSNTVMGGKSVFLFNVTGPKNFSDTLYLDQYFSDAKFGKLKTELYIHVLWICTKWNFEHEMMCSADQPPL